MTRRKFWKDSTPTLALEPPLCCWGRTAMRICGALQAQEENNEPVFGSVVPLLQRAPGLTPVFLNRPSDLRAVSSPAPRGFSVPFRAGSSPRPCPRTLPTLLFPVVPTPRTWTLVRCGPRAFSSFCPSSLGAPPTSRPHPGQHYLLTPHPDAVRLCSTRVVQRPFGPNVPLIITLHEFSVLWS